MPKISGETWSREGLLAGISGKITNFEAREFCYPQSKFYQKWYVTAPHPSVKNAWFYLLSNGQVDTSTGPNYEGFFDSKEDAEKTITEYLMAD